MPSSENYNWCDLQTVEYYKDDEALQRNRKMRLTKQKRERKQQQKEWRKFLKK